MFLFTVNGVMFEKLCPNKLGNATRYLITTEVI